MNSTDSEIFKSNIKPDPQHAVFIKPATVSKDPDLIQNPRILKDKFYFSFKLKPVNLWDNPRAQCEKHFNFYHRDQIKKNKILKRNVISAASAMRKKEVKEQIKKFKIQKRSIKKSFHHNKMERLSLQKSSHQFITGLSFYKKGKSRRAIQFVDLARIPKFKPHYQRKMEALAWEVVDQFKQGKLNSLEADTIGEELRYILEKIADIDKLYTQQKELKKQNLKKLRPKSVKFEDLKEVINSQFHNQSEDFQSQTLMKEINDQNSEKQTRKESQTGKTLNEISIGESNDFVPGNENQIEVPLFEFSQQLKTISRRDQGSKEDTKVTKGSKNDTLKDLRMELEGNAWKMENRIRNGPKQMKPLSPTDFQIQKDLREVAKKKRYGSKSIYDYRKIRKDNRFTFRKIQVDVISQRQNNSPKKSNSIPKRSLVKSYSVYTHHQESNRDSLRSKTNWRKARSQRTSFHSSFQDGKKDYQTQRNMYLRNAILSGKGKKQNIGESKKWRSYRQKRTSKLSQYDIPKKLSKSLTHSGSPRDNAQLKKSKIRQNFYPSKIEIPSEPQNNFNKKKLLAKQKYQNKLHELRNVKTPYEKGYVSLSYTQTQSRFNNYQEEKLEDVPAVVEYLSPTLLVSFKMIEYVS